MKMYFVRHGQTDENAKGIMLGSTLDVQLNETGLKQAQDIILDNDFDLFFCSPMKRCLQTAEAINQKLKKELIIRPELAERGKGSLEGKHENQLGEYTNGAITLEYLSNNLEVDFSPYGGETKEQVRERLQKFIIEVLQKHKDKKILVVMHMGLIKVLSSMYNIKPIGDIENGSVNILDIKI